MIQPQVPDDPHFVALRHPIMKAGTSPIPENPRAAKPAQSPRQVGVKVPAPELTPERMAQLKARNRQLILRLRANVGVPHAVFIAGWDGVTLNQPSRDADGP